MQKKIPAQKQKNNHARTARKSKLLRLKNFFKRVMDKRYEKKLKALKPKGITIVGNAKAQIGTISRFNRKTLNAKGSMNQRQKRKLMRQVPQLRKKYA